MITLECHKDRESAILCTCRLAGIPADKIYSRPSQDNAVKITCLLIYSDPLHAVFIDIFKVFPGRHKDATRRNAKRIKTVVPKEA